MSGVVNAIYIAPEVGADMSRHTSAELVAGKGITGDRHFGNRFDDQVTLIDADAIAAVNAETGWALTPEALRRNILTTGVDLNQWETSRFRVGGLLLEGVELAEPCAYLGGRLEDASRSAADIVRVLTGRAGLRARVIEGGTVASGDTLGPA